MTLKFLTSVLIICSIHSRLNAQVSNLLKEKTERYSKEIIELHKGHEGKKKKGIGNAFLNFYQKRVSALISADCIYVLSCSRFSREAVNKKGLILGVLMSADRLTRCSYPCSKDIPDYKINNDGLAEDNP